MISIEKPLKRKRSRGSLREKKKHNTVHSCSLESNETTANYSPMGIERKYTLPRTPPKRQIQEYLY